LIKKSQVNKFSRIYEFLSVTKKESGDEGDTELLANLQQNTKIIEETDAILTTKPTTIHRYHNGKKVVSTESLPEPAFGPSSNLQTPLPSTRLPSNITSEKLWPLFIFEVKNRILLDSTVAILFDTLDITYDDDSKVDPIQGSMPCS
jgi:hypothetical protein